MASRKEQKEQARAARVAQEESAAAKAQRTRRLQVFGGVIAIAVIAIVVVIVATSGGNGGGKTTEGISHNTTQQQAIVKAVNTELDGIPQKGNTLGDPNAKVTMTYFGDLQCPVCAAFSTGAKYLGAPPAGGLPEFIQKQVRTGNVKVIYKSFCTASCNNTSSSDPEGVFDKQQVAAYAAGEQNKAWYYIELFYRQQGAEGTAYVTDDFLNTLAGQTKGLTVATWKTDRGNPSLLGQVKAEDTLANKEALPGTPALIMTGPTGKQTLVNNGDFAGYSDLMTAVKEVS